MSFKSGDVVRLKSGGIAMTVSSIRHDGLVSCEWFDDKACAVKSHAFQEASLEEYKPEDFVGLL